MTKKDLFFIAHQWVKLGDIPTPTHNLYMHFLPLPHPSNAPTQINFSSSSLYSLMFTTHRMQSPAFISENAWLILSIGWRCVMNSSTLRSPFM